MFYSNGIQICNLKRGYVWCTYGSMINLHKLHTICIMCLIIFQIMMQKKIFPIPLFCWFQFLPEKQSNINDKSYHYHSNIVFISNTLHKMTKRIQIILPVIWIVMWKQVIIIRFNFICQIHHLYYERHIIVCLK